MAAHALPTTSHGWRQLARFAVEHLLMFAPANFGSDLARLGQSFLGKFRSTDFNSNHQGEDFLESGKIVLQGLEPASPFQWSHSADDLHGDGCFNVASVNAKFVFHSSLPEAAPAEGCKAA